MPTIVKIPISKLMPNDDQPRRRFRPGSIEEMAYSLKALGQQTPIKVRPMTEEEKAALRRPQDTLAGKSGLSEPLPEDDWDERNPDAEYMLIGGHRRLRGAELAGFEALDCIILNITPAETHLASLMDNNLDEMDWFDWDLAIIKEHQTHPKLSQRQLAKRLGISKGSVSNAYKLEKVLTPDAIDIIGMYLWQPHLIGADFAQRLGTDPQNGDKPAQSLGTEPENGNDTTQSPGKPKPESRVTEYLLLDLAVLADPEDPDLFVDASETVINYGLTAPEIKKFIEFVKDGGEPLDFIKIKWEKRKNKDVDPFAEGWKGLGPQIKVKFKGGEDYEIRLAVTGGQKAMDIAQSAQRALEGGLAAKLGRFLSGTGTT